MAKEIETILTHNILNAPIYTTNNFLIASSKDLNIVFKYIYYRFTCNPKWMVKGYLGMHFDNVYNS